MSIVIIDILWALSKVSFLQLIFSNLPPSISDKQVVVVDPMLATGQSVSIAFDSLLDMGVKEENILFLNLVSCPEGLLLLNQQYPKIKIITLAVDDFLNESKYIVPGLGDFGDRYVYFHLILWAIGLIYFSCLFYSLL